MNDLNEVNQELLLVRLDVSDLNAVMRLQDKVYDGLENKEVFAKSDKKEFEEAICNLGQLVGYKTAAGELVALGAYISYGYDKHNYGYDLEFKGDRLLTVGQIEATIVDPEYRGMGLQRKLCKVLEEVARAEGKTCVMATVSPLNPYSLNNFLAAGYENKKEKLKYGGLRRYILYKELT